MYDTAASWQLPSWSSPNGRSPAATQWSDVHASASSQSRNGSWVQPGGLAGVSQTQHEWACSAEASFQVPNG
ncbi:MAG: hypothetical protein AMXMBFR64_46090 [Myxococcales bacterium]